MMLKNSPIIASTILDTKVGEIAEGHAGDVIIAAYDPPTPLDPSNLWGHLIFGDLAVDTVVVGGEVVVEDGHSTLLDEARVFEKARGLATELWERT
jgi:cytosine/adenosine deaminase-related metal-dependent hydrolase